MSEDADDDKLRLGGMALRNGLLVHGPTSWAAAVRDSRGEIRTASGRKPRVTAADGVPGLRGVVRLGEAMAVIPLVKRALPEARLPFEHGTVAGAAVAATTAAALLRRRGRGSMAAELGAAAISVVPTVVALRSGDLAAYHGAEHKAIGEYEHDGEEQPKEHDRCGSHLMAPLVVSNLAGVALLKSVVEQPSPLAGSAVAMASLGIAVEVFGWSERHAGTATARALKAPGHELQRVLGTREPTAEQLAVGRAALAAVLEAEGAHGDA
jgi:uncharacterized protein YqhQ